MNSVSGASSNGLRPAQDDEGFQEV
jgi:hypothetical protein